MIAVGDREITVWVAANDEDRGRGLMEVEQLPPPIDGMLFVFEEPRPASFWMLNTLIPLDIWWFDGEGTLVGSTTMQPCQAQPCPSYPSPGPVGWALETPAGDFDFANGSPLRP